MNIFQWVFHIAPTSDLICNSYKTYHFKTVLTGHHKILVTQFFSKTEVNIIQGNRKTIVF